ncbi:MAG: aspartate aminotransferase family protein [Pirellulales bacterium]|nr:aspartate aminotransferase family protein [Pirellulales bacterium]
MTTGALPSNGLPAAEILAQLRARQAGDVDFRAGRVYGYTYLPEADVESLARDAFALYMTENALDPTSFPSIVALENDVVGIMAELLRGDEQVCGSFTSGGTESILLAVKTARDRARAERPLVTAPEMVLPRTAHGAFHKAAAYLGIRPVVAPIDPATFRALPGEMELAIGPNTILLVASAPSYAQGVVDPVPEIAAVAQRHRLPLHIDACVGGIALALMRRGGREAVPDFDFAVPGVTSISADLHKYGYSPKGASVVLYRSRELRRHQIFATMASASYALLNPVVQSSRSGGPVAAAWAVLHALGEAGYRGMLDRVMRSTRTLIAGVGEIAPLRVLGAPDMSMFAIASDQLNVFELADELLARGWYLQPQFSCPGSPPNLHVSVSHGNVGQETAFLEALRGAVDQVLTTDGMRLDVLREQLAHTLAGLSDEAALEQIYRLGGINAGALPERMALINSVLECLPRRLGEGLLVDYANTLYG